MKHTRFFKLTVIAILIFSWTPFACTEGFADFLTNLPADFFAPPPDVTPIDVVGGDTQPVPQPGPVSIRITNDGSLLADVSVLMFLQDVIVHRAALRVGTRPVVIGPEVADRIEVRGARSDGSDTGDAAFVFGVDFENNAIVEYFINDVPSIDALDSDGDGVVDVIDNCPAIANADQQDGDDDGAGDACDNCPAAANQNQINSDADPLGDACDNCPTTANAAQTDGDADGIGDACESDTDNDGVNDDDDNCPSIANSDQADADGDGTGDACESDADSDGVNDDDDNCPSIANANQANNDGDALGNACDNCPNASNDDQSDADGDGVGDACPVTIPQEPQITDCNGNGVDDAIDIAAGPGVVPAADACEGSAFVCPGIAYTGATTGFTNDGDSECGVLDAGDPDVWYRYVPMTGGSLTIFLCNSSFDTVVSVHPDCVATDVNEIACDDDGCDTGPSLTSELTLDVSAGVTYLIRIGGFDGDAGSYTMQLVGPDCLEGRGSTDCDGNGVPDECDMASCAGDPPCDDCNGNLTPDGCDIAGFGPALFGSTGEDDNLIYDIDAVTGEATLFADLNVQLGVNVPPGAGLALSPDGRTLFVSPGGEVGDPLLISVDTLTALGSIIGDAGRTVSDLIFLPDGTLVGSAPQTKELVTIDPNTAVATPRCSTNPVKLSGLAISRQGVVYGTTGGSTPSGTLFLVDPNTCQLTQIGSGTGFNRVPGLDFAPDGRLIGSTQDELIEIDTITGIGTLLTPINGATIVDGLAFRAGSFDCNENRVPDECDIADGTSDDTDENGIPDECELVDCNDNGIPDDVDIANCEGDPACGDCNENGVPDECDIADGTSSDDNQNGIPDECDPPPLTRLFVDDDAAGAGDGTSWADALNSLQDAILTAATSGGDITDIWVAAGNYKPDQGALQTPLDRSATFQLLDGVALYGGVAGTEDPDTFDLGTRDFVTHETILDGDLLADDALSVPLQVVNIDARIHNSDQPLGVPVTAGVYEATIVNPSIEGDASFTAWSFSFGGAGTWVTQYRLLLESGSGFIAGAFPEADSAQEAFDLTTDRTLRFSVPTDQTLWFSVSDNQLNDNQGGVSLLLSELVPTGNTGENSYHVVTGSGTDATAVLDGFTITAGNADGALFPDNGGAGMFNDSGSPLVVNCSFIGNSTTGIGGGLRNTGSSPTLTDCAFIGNTAPFGSGGAVFNSLSNPTLNGCTFEGNLAIQGGGMHNANSDPTLTDCLFTLNLASNQGGAMTNFNSDPSLTNCLFVSNATGGGAGGGAMHNNASSPTLIGCTFNTNAATFGFSIVGETASGGAMFNTGGGVPTLDNCTFSGNTAFLGGGMYNSGSSPTLVDCTFSANGAVGECGSGGGMYNTGGSPVLTGCTFDQNTSEASGGAMYNTSGGNPTLTGCTISRNAANGLFGCSGDGGGLCNTNSSNPSLTDCTLNGNTAANDGGAIRSTFFSVATVTNCLFHGNTATERGGAISDDSDTGPVITNSTLSKNDAFFAGGISFDPSAGNTSVTNCILWGNTDTSSANIEMQQIANAPVGSVSYTAIQDDVAGDAAVFPGTGNIDLDPNFVDTPNDDFHINAGSPAIDAADNVAVPDGITTDLDGNLRFHDDTGTTGTGNGSEPFVDMGAYEFQGTTPTGATTLFVDDDALPGGDGSDWSNAFKYLSDAILTAAKGGLADEIRVAQGTYRPDENEANPTGSGLRGATFALFSGVTINGAYAGIGAPDPDARDVIANPTILSGDLAENDTGPLDDPSHNENAFHVVTGSGSDATAVLSGFTIAAGNADGLTPDNQGGGIINESGSPTVIDCTIRGNFSSGPGAGMYNSDGSPTVIRCTLIGNSTGNSGFGLGGGTISDGGAGTYTDCIFSGNTAFVRGGGMYVVNNASPTLINCTFSGNSVTGGSGGGMFVASAVSAPTLVNCTFTGNSSLGAGTGIFNFGDGTTVLNCIIWGNVGQSMGGSPAPTVAFSDIEGGFVGIANINADPLFVDADGDDNTPGTADDNLRLSPGSPCIDAADNTAVPGGITTDIDGNPRFHNDTGTTDTGNGTEPIVDMGAYEFQGTTPLAGFVVTRFDDPPVTGCLIGDCSLREAIVAANTTPGADTIILDIGVYSLTIPGTSENSAFTGDLDITDDLTIEGADTIGTVVQANQLDRVFHVDPLNAGISVVINSLSVGNGRAPSAQGGGGISNQGNLTLNQCKISGNSSLGVGGGVENKGVFNGNPVTMTLNRCLVANNTSSQGGGGIINWFLESTVMDLNNTTISGNNANGEGGGIWNGDLAVANLNNVTITGNTSGARGGAYRNFGSTFRMRNTISAGNTDGTGLNHDCSDGFTISEGHNLIQSVAGTCIFSGDTTGNITGQDPLLGPLNSNGGAPSTHALLGGSPAIDAGDPNAPGGGGTACEATDQRGFPRPMDGDGDSSAVCDIGAFEVQP